jgi:hypothetical protein
LKVEDTNCKNCPKCASSFDCGKALQAEQLGAKHFVNGLKCLENEDIDGWLLIKIVIINYSFT